MTLPKLDVPTYTLRVLSTNTDIRYRPFLVKEEKILLVALESSEGDDITKAIQQIIENCIVEGNVNVGELPLFDIENIFLNIRAKSIGENSALSIPCTSETCEEYTEHNINLEEIDFVINENHNTKIELTNSVGVIMKYPSVNGLNDIEIEAEDEMQQSINLILACIESVYDDKAEYDFRDYTLQERNDFIENLTQQQLASIQEFFTTMPTLQYELDFKCSVCGTEDIIPITGLQNFFS
tara:strand:+ start:222 stop:938 length:717 start_codon:yes stop_codon:yes gene_type:complete